MKKVLSGFALAALAIGVTNAAHADLYYGVGYAESFGTAAVEEPFKEITTSTETNVTGSSTAYSDSNYEVGNSGITAMVGFPVKNNFAIETRYTYVPDAVTYDIKTGGDALVLVGEGEEESLEVAPFTETADYKASVHKFGLHGVYRHSLNSFLYVKGGAGITYTVYDSKGVYVRTINGEEDARLVNIRPKKFKEQRAELEASLGFGVRLSSCCNIELEYNSSQYQESATASLVWRY